MKDITATNGAGTRKWRNEWIRSGKGVVAVSRIAICTESQLRSMTLAKRSMPASVPTNCLEPISSAKMGCPGRANTDERAANAKGMAMKDRLMTYPHPSPERLLIDRINPHENANANQAPSGIKTFERINRKVITTFIRGSSWCTKLILKL